MAAACRIALDAMGGDHGPAVVIPGAALAHARVVFAERRLDAVHDEVGVAGQALDGEVVERARGPYGRRILRFRDGRLQRDEPVVRARDAQAELAGLPPPVAEDEASAA